ncbi:hypothetical protein [Streptomyces sp. NPDC004065]|uniref:hypothetical protein n=1 Tax=Streptomyces sp. NPDC004065 TaxID=3364689 RepID=UPI00385054E9
MITTLYSAASDGRRTGAGVLVSGAIGFGAVVGWCLAHGLAPHPARWPARTAAVVAAAGVAHLAAGPQGPPVVVAGVALGAGLHLAFRALVRRSTAGPASDSRGIR